MRTSIDIILVVIILTLLAGPKLNLKPFSISFETPMLFASALFLMLSLIFFGIHAEKKGYDRGWNKAAKRCIEIIKDSKYTDKE